MSALDYGDASSECYRSKNLNDYYYDSTCVDSNWVKDAQGWTISTFSPFTDCVFRINGISVLDRNYVTSELVAYLSLYLKFNVYIKGGVETKEDPYILFQ